MEEGKDATSLNNAVDELLMKQGVDAVIVTDKQGLSVACKSNNDDLRDDSLKKISSVTKALFDSAASLPALKGEQDPIVAVETDSTLVLISHNQGNYSTLIRNQT